MSSTQQPMMITPTKKVNVKSENVESDDSFNLKHFMDSVDTSNDVQFTTPRSACDSDSQTKHNVTFDQLSSSSLYLTPNNDTKPEFSLTPYPKRTRNALLDSAPEERVSKKKSKKSKKNKVHTVDKEMSIKKECSPGL